MKRLFLLSHSLFLISYSLFSQNVGIGTSTPSTLLHVSGTPNNIATFNGGGQMWVTLAENGNNRGYIGSYAGNAEDVDFGTYGSNLSGKVHLTTGNLPRLSVMPTGQVGIGTTSATVPLQFANSAGDKIALFASGSNYYGFGTQASLLQVYTPGNTDDIAFGYGSSNAFTETMRVKGNGNVGIGNASPQQNLSVGGGAVIDQNNGNTGTIATTLRFGSFSGEAIGSKRNAGTGQYGLDFYTSSNIRMSIANNGNVGIGTVTPSARLDVNGDVNLGNRLLLGNSAGNDGQALVSNGPGAAPSWQNIAYSNNDRFFFQSDNDNFFAMQDTIGYFVKYAYSSAITYNNKVFTVNKSGLYQFEGTISTRVITTGAGVYPSATLAVFGNGPSGSIYVLLMNDAFKYRGGAEWLTNTPFSIHVYLQAGSTFYISSSVNTSAGVAGVVIKQLFFSPLSINLVAE